MSEKQVSNNSSYVAFTIKCRDEQTKEIDKSKEITDTWLERESIQKNLSTSFDPIPSKFNWVRFWLLSDPVYFCPHCSNRLNSTPVFDEKGYNNYDGHYHHILACPNCHYKFAKSSRIIPE